MRRALPWLVFAGLLCLAATNYGVARQAAPVIGAFAASCWMAEVMRGHDR